MPKSISVQLAGQTYTIEQLPMRPSRQWREKLRGSRLMAIFDSLDGAIAEIVRVADNAADGGFGNVNVSELVGVAGIVPVVVQGLSTSIDDIIDFLFDYSPELRKDRERIEEEAYDDELVEAFCQLLRMAFPFGALWAMVRGPQAKQT